MKAVRTKNEFKKIESKILTGLLSASSADRIEAINKMRTEGRADFLPHVFDAWLKSKDEHLLAEIIKLINDIKDKAAILYILKALRDENLSEIHIFLLQSIWQSGADPTEHLEDLINFALQADYLLCFEVLTIIENLPSAPDEELVIHLTSRLHDAINDGRQNRELLLSMHEALNNYIIEG